MDAATERDGFRAGQIVEGIPRIDGVWRLLWHTGPEEAEWMCEHLGGHPYYDAEERQQWLLELGPQRARIVEGAPDARSPRDDTRIETLEQSLTEIRDRIAALARVTNDEREDLARRLRRLEDAHAETVAYVAAAQPSPGLEYPRDRLRHAAEAAGYRVVPLPAGRSVRLDVTDQTVGVSAGADDDQIDLVAGLLRNLAEGAE